jgi:hypothetical protein
LRSFKSHRSKSCREKIIVYETREGQDLQYYEVREGEGKRGEGQGEGEGRGEGKRKGRGGTGPTVL